MKVRDVRCGPWDAGYPGAGRAATRDPRRRAFTLIEMLVVIAIIGLLASLLMAAMGPARQAARRAKARDEVLQIKTAWESYLHEYRKFPSASLTEMTTAALSILRGGDTANNPKKVVFMDFRGSTTKFEDPWGAVYKFALDTDYNNEVAAPEGVVAAQVAVWSLGPDGEEGTKDDQVSWRR